MQIPVRAFKSPEYQPSNKPDVCVSLDGFLATASDLAYPLRDPRPGAAAFTKRLAKTAHVVIYTSRLNLSILPDYPSDAQLDAAVAPVHAWLTKHGIWFDGIWVGRGRPPADLFVGPEQLVTPFNPTPDDFVDVEAQIKARLK